MITVRLMGGLGNQLFGFALGLAFEARGRNVKYDVTMLDQDAGRRYLLGDLGWNLNVVRENAPVTYQEKSLLYDPEVLNLKDGVLSGYWQNEKYFEQHAAYVRGAMFRQMKMSNQTLAVGQKIKECGERSCFVHVRRSDNLRPTSTLYHGLTEANDPYYGLAIERVRDQIAAPHFFIFSDDPKYVEETVRPGLVELTKVTHNAPSFTEDETHNLHKNDSGREVEDLWLMSLCRHAIIANSTFSWWGAFLNHRENEDPRSRIVVCPSPWYSSNEAGETEILPDRWLKVPTK